MKKLALALVCLVSIAFFSSCDPEEILNPEPTIAVITGENFVTGTAENPQIIDMTDDIDWKFGFHVESNAQTKKELSNMTINYQLVENGELYESTITIDLSGKTSYDYTEYLFEEETKEIVSEYTINATVTDVDGKTMSATIAMKFDVPAYPLEAVDFSWVRANGAEGEGLEMLGLKWEKNVKDINAVIEPIDGAVLYEISDATLWDKVQTDQDLYSLFLESNAAVVIKDYRGVSCLASHDYDDLIATYYQGEYYLIHITHCTVEQRGYVFTIEGQWK